ncbi:Cholecystokinin receptor, partial [Pseudolycoriella hygida]
MTTEFSQNELILRYFSSKNNYEYFNYQVNNEILMMWKKLIISFISLGFVSCQTNCPGFSNYQNDPSLLNDLDGDFMMVYTTSAYIIDCERIQWSVGPNNNRTAYLKDANGCCRRIDNFDSSNPQYYQHDITPLNSQCSYLKSTEKVNKKLVASTGVGLDLCLIIYICHPSRHGLLVVCRQLPSPSLWTIIGKLLTTLLSLLIPTPWKTLYETEINKLNTNEVPGITVIVVPSKTVTVVGAVLSFENIAGNGLADRFLNAAENERHNKRFTFQSQPHLSNNLFYRTTIIRRRTANEPHIPGDCLNEIKMSTNYTDEGANNTIQRLVVVSPSWLSTGRIQIPLYTTILLLAVTGNALVIMTLVQNRRMRTITNVFLLNLAVSDILLGVLCMPFTLIGTLLRDFVFGEIMCKFLPYLQASSVAVSAWTLVAISCERYYAICHPLSSRRWQTLKHAYKLIGLIWFGSFLFMSPIAVLSRLIPTNQGLRKCREFWPEGSKEYEKTFNLYLDVILLVIPLIMLGATYSLITKTLWQGMRDEKSSKNDSAYDTTQSSNNLVEVYLNAHGTASTRCPSACHHQSRDNMLAWHQLKRFTNDDSWFRKETQSGTNAEKSLQNKKRIIQMLFVVVLEFFICWTPLYVINTIALFNPQLVYNTLGYTSISFCQLMAYSSSCCNPITYCFMNRGFRKAFLNLFRCFKKFNEPRRMSIGYGGTQISEADVNRLQQPLNRQFHQTSESVNPANNELQLYNIMHSLNSPPNVTKPQTFTDNNNK